MLDRPWLSSSLILSLGAIAVAAVSIVATVEKDRVQRALKRRRRKKELEQNIAETTEVRPSPVLGSSTASDAGKSRGTDRQRKGFLVSGKAKPELNGDSAKDGRTASQPPAVSTYVDSEAAPSTAEDYKMLGNRKYTERRFAEAVQLYSKAIELEPSNAVYKLNRAAAHLEAGDWTGAEADCVLALASRETIPDDALLAKGYSRLGTAQLRLGKAAEAKEAFAKSLALKDNIDVRQKLEEAKKMTPEIAELNRFSALVRRTLKNVTPDEEAIEAAVETVFEAFRDLDFPTNAVAHLQRLIPEQLFVIFLMRLQKDIQSKGEEESAYFAKLLPEPIPVEMHRYEDKGRGLVSKASFAAGDVVFNEIPFAAHTFPNVEEATFCGYCLKDLVVLTKPASELVVKCEDCLEESYCCAECRHAAAERFHRVVCFAGPSAVPSRRLKNLCDSTKKRYPLLALRILARLCNGDKDAFKNQWEHIDRLHYYALPEEMRAEFDETRGLIIDILTPFWLEHATPIRDFLTHSKYAVLVSKILFNNVMICTQKRPVRPPAIRAPSSEPSPATSSEPSAALTPSPKGSCPAVVPAAATPAEAGTSEGAGAVEGSGKEAAPAQAGTSEAAGAVEGSGKEAAPAQAGSSEAAGAVEEYDEYGMVRSLLMTVVDRVEEMLGDAETKPDAKENHEAQSSSESPSESAPSTPAPATSSQFAHTADELSGVGMFLLASYMNHSCAPNTKLHFAQGTHRLSVVASTNIAPGEEVTRAYVKVAGKTARQRHEMINLIDSFECKCPLCIAGVDL